MTDKFGAIQEFDTRYNEAYYAWNPFYPLAERDLRFYLGDQWDESEKRQLFEDGRSSFVFNRIRPAINFITGYQIQNRNDSVVMPVIDEYQRAADQHTKAIFHVMKNSNGYQKISEAFAGSAKTGWNLLNLWMDYRYDPENGDIRISRIPYNGFICDPYFTDLAWSDCNYVLMRKYLSLGICKSLLPKKKRDLELLYKNGWERDDKFTWLPYQRQPSGENLMAYNEAFYQKWRSRPAFIDTDTGELTKWDGDKRSLREFLSMFSNLRETEVQERYIEKQIIVNDELLDTQENQYGLNEYPFVNFIPIFEPESDQWSLKVQSLIRAGIDPQREGNRRRSQMVDMTDSQLNSGWIADEKSVINPRSLFQTSQGKVIWRREDAKPGAIEKIQPAQIPPSSFQLQELFDKDINFIMGLNDAAFGEMQSANQPAVMQLMQQASSIANLQEVMENLRISQRSLTIKMIKMIQQWTPEKVEKIIGEPVDELFYDPDLTKYHIEITEGTSTATQKQLYFRQLVELQQLGVPVTPTMLAKAAPLQGKSEYNQQIQEMEKQQAQQAQKEAEIQERILRSQENMNQAKAIGDIAMSKERFTRAIANMGLEDERASQAIENRSDATLNRMKAVKELESMDDDTIIKYLDLFMRLEEMNRVKEEQVKEDDVVVSAAGSPDARPQPNSSSQKVKNPQMEAPNEGQ